MTKRSRISPSSSSTSSSSFSSLQSEQIIIKDEPTSSLPKSYWFKSLSLDELLNRLREAIQILMGNKESVNGCESFGDAIINFIKTGEKPTGPIPDEEPSGVPPEVKAKMIPINASSG